MFEDHHHQQQTIVLDFVVARGENDDDGNDVRLINFTRATLVQGGDDIGDLGTTTYNAAVYLFVVFTTIVTMY